jgi:hypothetical protein
MQSALGEGNREGDDSYANLEDRDKETDILGVSLQMLEIAADFLLGPTSSIREEGGRGDSIWLPGESPYRSWKAGLQQPVQAIRPQNQRC